MSNVETKVKVKYGDAVVVHHSTEIADHEAGLALKLIERWGLVAAEPDGEDAAGRQKGKLRAIADLVRDAFDTAEEAFRVARERGHMVNVPTLADMEAAEAAAKKKDPALHG